jgi:hypothetical protein
MEETSILWLGLGVAVAYHHSNTHKHIAGSMSHTQEYTQVRAHGADLNRRAGWVGR